MVTLVRPAQPLNALGSISVTPFGMVSVPVRPVPANAFEIVFRPLERRTPVMPVN